MTTCPVLHANLFAYVEKSLSPALMLEIDTHVIVCPKCAALLAEFKSVMEIMDDQKFIEPLPFAETRIMQGIESRMEKRGKPATTVFGRILHPAIISVGFAAALAIGFFIGSDFAAMQTQYSQNDEMIEAVRTDLNVPDFMTDDIIYFTE